MDTQIPCFVARHKEAGTVSMVNSFLSGMLSDSSLHGWPFEIALASRFHGSSCGTD